MQSGSLSEKGVVCRVRLNTCLHRAEDLSDYYLV